MNNISKLAILGGDPVFDKSLPPYNTIGNEEISAANEVLKTGLLSGFVASPGDEFFGGDWTKVIEQNFCDVFSVSHAITVNSATSGLHAALQAAGVKEGDEVIVSPYSMSASATSIVMCGAKPVFVDIEPDYFCIDVNKVKEAITKDTKAIMAVNIFGQPAHLSALLEISKKHSLTLIEDNAQAPKAKYFDTFSGTVGHMGVFSLNRHKTMQCGEGGVVVTNDQKLATRLQMVRNHGEAVLPETDFLDGNEDIIGYNYRLTELQAAIANPQLKRLDQLNQHRINLANYLSESIRKYDFITEPKIRESCTHVYYLYPMVFDENKIGISRDLFLKAMQAEGAPLSNYVRPLPLIPLYENKFGKCQNYQIDNLPVVKELWKSKMLVTPICRPPLNETHIDKFVLAIEKVCDQLNHLRKI